MSWIENLIRRVDAVQRRYKPSAFVFGVIKKYGDDAGGRLVADLAHSAFITLFPLFLVLVTLLGLVQPPLTKADRAVLAAQALQNQRRDDQLVRVIFADLPADVYAAGRHQLNERS